MKLTSLTSVTFAAWGGSLRSSRRAAVSPPNPPPRITMSCGMAPRLLRQQEPRPLAAMAAVGLAQAVTGERGGHLAGLLAQQARHDQARRRPPHHRRDVEQQRP